MSKFRKHEYHKKNHKGDDFKRIKDPSNKKRNKKVDYYEAIDFNENELLWTR